MKKSYIFITLIIIFTLGMLQAQNTHTIDFEAAGVGADWDWTMDQNGDNPPLEFIANPVSGGLNTSATVAQFTARQAGQPWALCFTNDDGEFTFDATNSTVSIMVYKPEISNIAMKFEGMSPPIEIQVPNTLVNEWEVVTFDFTASIGNTYDRIVIIPDFNMDGREQDNIIYLDDIMVPDGEVAPPPTEPTVAAPDPTNDEANVFSIYSDVYTDLEGTNFNPSWGQSTVVTLDYLVDGNNTIKYEGLNYQGTNLGSVDGGVPQDVSEYDFLHIDFWTPNSTALNFYVLDQTAGEVSYALPITPEVWVSVDIPLSHFAGENMADIHQFKVDGNGTVWFDNWFFWSTPQEIVPEVAAPAPTIDEANVFSIYSDVYTDLEGTNFNPAWGQSTIVTIDYLVDGDNTLKYENLNYQGTNLGSVDGGVPQDVSEYEFLHIDFWTSNSTALNFYVLDQPGPEVSYALPITAEEWVSVDIPLSYFSDGGEVLSDIHQFKVDGNGTVWFDNWYFYTTSSEDILFFDDFESGSGNWTLEGTWAVTDEESHSPSNSLHDSPGGNYAANLNISATLATPWDLSGVLNANLSYWYMCDIETAFDYMYAEISTDGETWLNLETYDIQDMTEFVQEEIALGGFVGAGYETVWLRFRLETDGGFEINGMYIDDVLVTTSMEDTAAPFIIHTGPAFYEGTAEDYVFTAVINDVSGIAEANVIYTLDEGDPISAPVTSVDGNVYTFTIPAQDAGVQVDYAIEAIDASENSNVGMMDGFVYIAGTPFIYDNGIVDFYTTITEGTGAAVRIDNPAGFQLNLAYALIRNYTDQSGQDNDDFEFHVWADNGGVPGADLITPFIVSPEASYTNTSAMTRIDLRPYADDLADIQGNFYIGFLANTGGEYGVVHCTITQPGFWPNSFAFDGTGWAALDGFSDYHFRAVAELIPTAVGTVEGIVTRSDTGDPLEGALVAIGGASDETAADGSYSLITDPGEMSVTVTLDGYNVFNGTVTVVQDDVVEYDVQLSPAFWAPGNLAATYNPPNPNVVLQWDAPAPPTGETVELIYDNDVSTGAYSYEGYSMGTQMSPEQSCHILQLKIHTSAGSGFNAEVLGLGYSTVTEDMLYQELVTDVEVQMTGTPSIFQLKI